MDIEDGRVTGLIGDKHDPAYYGFTCRKGRDLPAHLYHPNRLLQPQRRNASGDYETVSPGAAISEIAERLGAIIAEHGPAALALYSGTYALPPPASMLTGSFMHAIGSPMSFGCGSIDQPGKIIATALHGRWRGGSQPFDEAETWLFVGTNPVISKLGGLPTQNPARHLHRAARRGMKLIVIDPRYSEIAEKAQIHLQPIPGEDAAILAGMIRIVLSEELYDTAFVDENTRNIEALRRHVEPFTPEHVAKRADIPRERLIEAAHVFARAATGGANAGTGVNLAPRGTLTEYLLSCLMTLCGFWQRAGQRVANAGVLMPRAPHRAQPTTPTPGWGFPPKLRVNGLSNTACGLPTAALADEMLLEGKGQIRAMICMGGNPMMAWPDQIKTRQALEGLELLVVVDPKHTQTAQLADYVIPPKLAPEIPASTFDIEALQGTAPGWGYPIPYAHYAPALIDPPAGSELLEDWEFLYLLGREMGLELKVRSASTRIEGDPPARTFSLDMTKTPTHDELLDILTVDARVPLSELRRHEEGRTFDEPETVVRPREPDCQGYLELGNDAMMSQLDHAARGPLPDDEDFPFRLISRRTANTLNSQGRDQEKLVRDWPHNPAYLHPEDLAARGIATGDLVAITSRRTTIHAVAEASTRIRRGVISMSHSYGLDIEALDPESDDPGRAQPYGMGGHTGALASAELDYFEEHSGLPRMSAIPVHLQPIRLT